MTPITKKLVVAGLALGAVATWAPQLMSLIQSEGPSDVNADQPAFAEPTNESDGEQPAGGKQASESGTSLTPNSDGILQLRNILAERDAHRRQQILLQEHTTDNVKDSASEQPPDHDWNRPTQLTVERSKLLVDFLKNNPLCAIISGRDNSLAVFGSNILRVGDAIPGTQAVVMEIEARSVRIQDGRELHNCILRRGSTTRQPLSPSSVSPDTLRAPDALPNEMPASMHETQEGDRQ